MALVKFKVMKKSDEKDILFVLIVLIGIIIEFFDKIKALLTKIQEQ